MSTATVPHDNLADLPDAIRSAAALLRRAETMRCNASAEHPAPLTPLETESLLHLIELAADRLEVVLQTDARSTGTA